MNSRQRKYWIIVASKEHVKESIKGSFAQACHGKSTPLKKMKKGDYVIYYSSKLFFGKSDKCQEFTAIGKVKNDKIYSVEMTADFMPFRIDIDFMVSKDISILPLINDLEFIKNKAKWGYPFRYGILEINEHDFKLISKLMLSEEEINFHFTQPEDNIGYLLWQTTMQWQREMNRALNEVDLTHTQFVVLIALAWLSKTSAEVTQKDIAEHSKIDKMMLSKVLNKLKEKELIDRREHKIDRRAKCVFLTEKGKETLQNAIEIKTKANDLFFKSLSNEDFFADELRRLTR